MKNLFPLLFSLPIAAFAQIKPAVAPSPIPNNVQQKVKWISDTEMFAIRLE